MWTPAATSQTFLQPTDALREETLRAATLPLLFSRILGEAVLAKDFTITPA